MNYKQALRKETNYLRGFDYLDQNLKNEWIKRNFARLQHAKQNLTESDYNYYKEYLYKYQVWKDLEGSKYEANYKPTLNQVNNAINRRINDVDITLKYAPDLDENNNYVGAEKNTGLSPNLWSQYNMLKDDASRKQFLKTVRTDSDLKEDSKARSALYDYSTIALSESGNYGPFSKTTYKDIYDEYLAGIRKPTKQALSEVTQENTDKANAIYSQSLEKYRNTSEFQKELAQQKNKFLKSLTPKNHGTIDAQVASKYYDVIKENPLLSAASGYNSKTGQFDHQAYDQYLQLLRKEPGFKTEYLSYYTLYKNKVDKGEITEEDMNQSLIDIVASRMKEHQLWNTKLSNDLKAIGTTAVTYTLNKFAPIVNLCTIKNRETDGKIFLDSQGKIYSDSDVLRYGTPSKKNADFVFISVDDKGNPIDKDIIKNTLEYDGDLYVHKSEDGKITPITKYDLESLQQGFNDPHLIKINKLAVKNTKVGTMDLMRLGVDDSGKQLNNIFNEKYISKASQYNVMPWEKSLIDYYDQTGYSNYVNVTNPGEVSYFDEVIKMGGFALADGLMTAATLGFGAVTNVAAKTTISMINATLGALGIADSYAQSVFEENFNANQQTLQNDMMNYCKRLAAEDIESKEYKQNVKDYINNKLQEYQKHNGPLSESQKAQFIYNIKEQILNDRTQEYYQRHLYNSGYYLIKQEEAIRQAGNAALCDMIGEGIKYGVINAFGFRSWLFKGAAAKSAAKATERIVGKTGSNLTKATAEDVEKGLAKKVGDTFLKKTYATLSKKEKLKIIGKFLTQGAFEGFWTNWTDELQSGSAKEQNNRAYQYYVSEKYPDGVLMLGLALGGAIDGFKNAAFTESSLNSGVIGALGSVASVQVHPIEFVKALTVNRNQLANLSKTEKAKKLFGTLFSNGISSKIQEVKANEEQFSQLLERYNAINNSLGGGNAVNIIKALSSAAKIGHSEYQAENEEQDVMSLLGTLQAIKAFAKNNQHIVDFDYNSNINRLLRDSEKLTDTSKLSAEEKKSYTEQIKILNPEMTNTEAEAHLDNVIGKRAKLMSETVSKWEELQASKSYQKADSKTQRSMELEFELSTLQNYVKQNMIEREKKISGNESPEGTTLKGEKNEITTYGNNDAARQNIIEAHEIEQSTLKAALERLAKAKESLNYDAKMQHLKENYENADSTQKKEIQEEINTLEQDYRYYEFMENYVNDRLNNSISEQARLTELFKNHKDDHLGVLSDSAIINLDAVSRARMLDENNFENYSPEQQVEIKKAKSKLKEQGVTDHDIVDQALAMSRYNQREKFLQAVRNGEQTELSMTSKVTESLNIANRMYLTGKAEEIKQKFEDLDFWGNVQNKQSEAQLSKKIILKTLDSGFLKYLRERVSDADKNLIDEILPLQEATDQMNDLIFNDQIGLKNLTNEEREAIRKTVATQAIHSDSRTELFENLAKEAEESGNQSLTTLLDKMAQVYAQDSATIAYSQYKAREAAKTKRAEERAKAEKTLEKAGEPAKAEKVKDELNDEESEKESKEETTKEETEKGSNTELVSSEKEENQQKSSEEVLEEAKKEQLPNFSNCDSFLIKGEEYQSSFGITGSVGFDISRNSNSWKYPSSWDTIIRDIIAGQVRVFSGVSEYPETFQEAFYGALLTAKKQIESKGETLKGTTTVYHKFPNGVKAVTSIDLYTYNESTGQYNLYQVAITTQEDAFSENSNWETNSDSGNRDSVIGLKEQYENQASLAALLFQKMTGKTFGKIELIPIKCIETDGVYTGVELLQNIPMSYNKDIEKYIAYQPNVQEALAKIAEVYDGIFSNEQLATIKGIILNGLVKGEAIGKDLARFIQSQGLEDQLQLAGIQEMHPIIKNLKESVSKINVQKAINGEQKEEQKASTSTQDSTESTQKTIEPKDVAKEEDSGREYDPKKETYSEPDIDAEFNTVGPDEGSTSIPQESLVAAESSEDSTVEISKKNDADLNSNTEENANTFKGNAMNPYIYEDKTEGVEEEQKQDVRHGILVEKEAGDSMAAYKQWMKTKKINYQGLVDEKLSDILATGTEDNPVKIRFMRVNYKKVGNEGMKDHYLLVIEDSPAIRKVYSKDSIEKYGDFVEANGKKYLIVGTAGFANTSQGNTYRNIFTKGSESVRAKSDEYFEQHPDEEFYVDQDRYTHVAKMHSGFLTKQLTTDSTPKVRKVSELLADPERNPLGLTWDDLVFGYQMRNEFRTVPAVDSSLYHAPIRTSSNLGNVYMYIKGADGKYTPAVLVPTRYSEIAEGSLKNKIDGSLRQLTSLDHKERYKGLLALYDLIVLGQKDSTGTKNGPDILIGTDENASLTFKLNNRIIFTTNLKNVDFQSVLEAFKQLNPRISVTRSKLLNIESLKELDAARALRLDLAKLCKSSGDYSLYNIGPDGKPIITESIFSIKENHTLRESVSKVWVDDQYYTKQGNNYVNEKGETVTDDSIIQSIKLNELIINNNMESSVTLNGTEYFISNSDGENSTIIGRTLDGHKAYIVNNAVELTSIINAIQKQSIKNEQKRREDAADAELNKEVEETQEQKSETPSEPVNTKDSITELLNMDTEKQEQSQEKKPTASTENTSNSNTDINHTEKKALAEPNSQEKSTTFTGEKNALDILTDDNFGMQALEEIVNVFPETEDMTLGEIVEHLKNKGKKTEGIKDIQSWIDTLKC